jgi:hypothetical protein
MHNNSENVTIFLYSSIYHRTIQQQKDRRRKTTMIVSFVIEAFLTRVTKAHSDVITTCSKKIMMMIVTHFICT